MLEVKSCPLCHGDYIDDFSTYTIDMKSSIVIIREVPVLRCAICGEEYIQNEVMKNLQRMINDAREKEVYVEIAKYKVA